MKKKAVYVVIGLLIGALGIFVAARQRSVVETRVVVVTETPIPPTVKPSPPTATPIPPTPTTTPEPWDAQVSALATNLLQLPHNLSQVIATLPGGITMDLLAVTEDKEWVQATAYLGGGSAIRGWLQVDKLKLNVSLDDLEVDTETAFVQSTSVPESTPAASPEPQLIFEDDFESGEGEWFVEDSIEVFTHVSDGQLLIELNRANWAAWTEHPEFGLLEDSVLEVDISFISGPTDSAAGIVFRCLGEGGDFLKISFNADGFLVVAITNFVDGGYLELVPWTRYVDIEPGQAVNHVRVIDDDQQFNMFINDQHVADLNFSDMVPPGCPSLFAETFDQAGAVWAFDNFRVREVGGTDNAEADAAPAALTHDYRLDGSFTDDLGGPALVPAGGTLNPTNYSFGPNQGLSLSNGLIDSANYSIEMIFNLSGESKFLDFKDLGSDNGIYNFIDKLEFYPGQIGPPGAIPADTDVHLVVTRDSSSNRFVGYVDGVQQISFTDSSGDAIFSAASNIIQFFKDDVVFADPASAGVVNRIRIYDGVLTPSEVAALSAE